MEWLSTLYTWLLTFIEYMLHLDKHLVELINAVGNGTYAVLFLIIFAETGLVFTPFLPGDSLLFAIGAIVATGALNIYVMVAVLYCAAVIGDNTNYWIGRYIGPRIFSREKSWFFNPEHLQRTQKFYEKHGGKTIIIARFMPIVRTFAPFVAGIGKMSYLRFLAFSLAGSILWVPGLTCLGFFFGNLPVVKEHFTLVIFAIIGISIMPGIIEFWRHRNSPEGPVEPPK